MSEAKQQPKILLHKPKKSQRSPSGASVSTSQDGVGHGRGVSTASSTPPPDPPGPKRPIWYRFRTPLATLLVVNAVLVGYVLFRTSFKSVEPFEEADSVEKKETEGEDKSKKAEKERKKADIVETKNEAPKLSESENVEAAKTVVPEPPKVSTLSASIVPQQVNVQAASKPFKPSNEEQQELFKWMLAEKRKVKPTTKAEKAHIDAEKALLKQYIRGKSVLNLQGESFL